MILLEGLAHISLGSSDLERSVAFFSDVLGFDVVEEDEGYAVLHMDPVAIRLNLMNGYRSPVQNPGEASLSFVLDVDDFTNAIEELEQQEIEILKGPVGIQGGESILIADPDGNLIELFYTE